MVPENQANSLGTQQRNDESSDEFQFINSQFNEHLYAEVDGSLLDGHRRYVLTWRRGGSRAGSSWKFEHDGDNVYLRNAHNGEYLFADNTKKRDDDRRSVFTFIVGSKTNDSQWEFIDCDNTVSDTGYQTEDTKVKPAKQLSLLSNSSSASPKVCIRNVRYNEYLFVEGPSTYWYDQNTRYVLTKKGGEKYDANEPGKFVWILERTNDYYQIINLQYKEHLFADINGSLPIESHRRHILSWRKGGQRTGSTWKLEPEGDYVYIKNVYNNEYLFADFDKKRDEDRRMVFSFIFGGKTEDSKWELIDCSNLQSEVQSQIKDITKKEESDMAPMKGVNLPGNWNETRKNDEFQIINYQFNEHLYAEIDGPSPELDYCRYVFTWRKTAPDWEVGGNSNMKRDQVS
ncbi:sphingomyelin phosphodiesterase [Sarracenia purpurea var. burkii]